MIMKSKFLKIAGVSSEKEFYKKFPTEESFFAAHPEAREMKKGGSMEAFPQTITADKFFSYGVPAPPNYLKSGGMPNLYPQIQSEKQFFIPIYTNSPNAYAYGGMPEVFPQVGPVDYQPPVNMPLYMDQGGTATPPADYPVSKGVNNTTGNFVSWLRNKSYSASEKEATKNAMGMMKNGGRTLPYMEPVRTVADNGTNVTTTGNTTTPQPATGYTQEDFNKFFNPAMDAWVQSYMSRMQQPNYGYAGYTDMRGFIPSMYAYNYDPRYKFTARNAQGLMGRGTSNMPLIHAMLPELYSGNKSYDELMKDPNFKNRMSTLGLTSYSERPRGLFGKRTERTYTFGSPTYNPDAGTSTTPPNTPPNTPPSPSAPSAASTTSGALPGPVTTPPADQGQFWKNWVPTLNQSTAPLLGPTNKVKSILSPEFYYDLINRPKTAVLAAPNTTRHNVPVTNFSNDPRIRKQQEEYNRIMGFINGPEINGPSNQTPATQGEHELMPDLNNAKGEHYDQIMHDGRTKREHLRDMLNSGDPEKIKQVNYELSTFYRYGGMYSHGGLHKAQGGFSFSPDDEAGDAPVNPMGVIPSTGLTEKQMRAAINDDSFGLPQGYNLDGKTGTGKLTVGNNASLNDNVTITEKEKGPLAGMFNDFYTNQFYKRFVTDALNSRHKPDSFLLEDTITGINPAMNFGQDPLSRKQMAGNFGNSAIQQDRGLHVKFGGQYSVGDEIEMTIDELNEFIQNGGQVDFI